MAGGPNDAAFVPVTTRGAIPSVCLHGWTHRNHQQLHRGHHPLACSQSNGHHLPHPPPVLNAARDRGLVVRVHVARGDGSQRHSVRQRPHEYCGHGEAGHSDEHHQLLRPDAHDQHTGDGDVQPEHFSTLGERHARNDRKLDYTSGQFVNRINVTR
ncbi:hypothetical protein AVEN_80176-1 [Araneus ventricosus]|uniref:Uncharacterized protein n=1 Tax=Araneus ventricosus TaxID=182803 RepID=A0A4Y2L1I1_ARAVE|nr:hypothetical protein AVEN_80176-1 [Araneus ventricosus]